MKQNILLFAVAFAIGATLTLTARSVRHQPDAPAAAAKEAAHDHAAESLAKPVNTTCAICGMKVDPRIKTATYQGKTIGFGCGACPATFAANPDRYGPAALQNKVVE